MSDIISTESILISNDNIIDLYNDILYENNKKYNKNFLEEENENMKLFRKCSYIYELDISKRKLDILSETKSILINDIKILNIKINKAIIFGYIYKKRKNKKEIILNNIELSISRKKRRIENIENILKRLEK